LNAKYELLDPLLFSAYLFNPNNYVPYSFKLNPSTQQAQINEVATKFKQMYFYGLEPSALLMNEWAQFQSDSIFSYGVDRTVRYHAAKSSPVYFYQFSKQGTLNIIKQQNLLNDIFDPGVMHGDVSGGFRAFEVTVILQSFSLGLLPPFRS
jgi:hypothetical protein